MASRETILAAIQANQPDRLPLPEQFTFETTYPDLVTQFADVLATVGGRAVTVPDYTAIATYLDETYADVLNIGTTIPELAHVSDIDLTLITVPHDLAGLNLAIIGGQLGVAENAAIWVDEQHIPSHFRALPMITQYLAIVIRQADLVTNMHEAYRRIDVAATGFGTFISGPSKTADIEQSLVIGAHGARGLTVFIMMSDE
ncbi:lactate utilization protein C [uncultured Fibrella sp.]|uniref:LutC/YkgG family protein n=1 Tax=uncultured Fibrella sp. TaxID=1284596 RepID=UPI0035CB8C77